MKKTLRVVGALALAACGGKKSGNEHLQAVGTYIGGGSMIAGADPCTYTADKGVLDGDGDKGPKFVLAAGEITQKCGDQAEKIRAVVPTGAKIVGPLKVKANAPGELKDLFEAKLVAGDAQLDGEASIEWQLDKDCEGHATFAPVMGSQDTGGPDRSRRLVTTAPGSCTLMVGLLTGSALSADFKPQTFKAVQKVAIE